MGQNLNENCDLYKISLEVFWEKDSKSSAAKLNNVRRCTSYEIRPCRHDWRTSIQQIRPGIAALHLPAYGMRQNCL